MWPPSPMRWRHEGIEGGRRAVVADRRPRSRRARRGGRRRAAIESLAENFSDGVVAPLFWLVVGGLPGGAAYKAINTADSMIGHRTTRYRAFGWAAARLDDLVNLPASRLAALLIVAGRGAAAGCRSRVGAWRAVAPRRAAPSLAQRRLAGSGDGRRARACARRPARLWRRHGRRRAGWATAAASRRRGHPRARCGSTARLPLQALVVAASRAVAIAVIAPAEQPSQIEVASRGAWRARRGCFDQFVVGARRLVRRRAAPATRALPVVGEQPVDIGADHAAVGATPRLRRGRRRSCANGRAQSAPVVRPCASRSPENGDCRRCSRP